MPFDIFYGYLLLFFIGIIYAVVSAVLSGAFGGDFGADHHVDLGGHHGDIAPSGDGGMVHFSPLSPTVIATFLTAFGGTGIICVKVFNMSGYLSLPVSMFAGLCVAAAVFVFFEWIFEKTQASVNIEASRMGGTHADVITPIPANGMGEIAFIASGLRQNAPARSEDNTPIESPAEVEIIRSVGGSYVVRRVAKTTP